MAEIVVDVAALAALLGQPAVKSGDRFSSGVTAGERGASSVPLTAQECPLGHHNATTARFCAECGLPLGEMVLAPRVDLDAVRQAVRPGAALTAAEQQRRDREHMEAIAANLRAEQEVVDISQQDDPSTHKVLIHFVEDGFTWAGRVFNRGDELELGPEHPRWESAVGWIRLAKDEQFRRYGRVFFDYGRYPGRQIPPGHEMLLPTAGVNQWAVMRGGIPATQSPERDGSLIPR